MTHETTQERPLVTFALFAYNQEKYIREAIEGAFAQTYEPLEIILSDDCSSDDTFKLIERMAYSYKGPHRVKINKNPENLGIGRHIKSVSSLASGKILVLAAGDDISRSDRVACHVGRYDDSTYAVFSDLNIFSSDVNKSERQKSWIKLFSVTLKDIVKFGGGVATGATYSYRKECFELPWGYPDKLTSEDRILPLRAALKGDVKYINEPLVFYRDHDNNISKSDDLVVATLNDEHIAEVARTIEYYMCGRAGSSYSLRHLKRMHRLIRFEVSDHYKKIESLNGSSVILRVKKEFSIFNFGFKYYILVLHRRLVRALSTR